MLTDKQSLLLCGLMTGGIFVAGVLEILNNFMVLTILTIVFFTIVANIFKTKSDFNKKEESKNSN